MHSETDVNPKAIEETQRGRLSGFVIIGFFFALFLAIYPALSSMLAEVHPAAPWQGPAAVARNRIIAALSRVVCVIEPRKTGGSIETARQALAQGKPVFASGHSRLPAGLLAELRSLYRQNTFDEAALADALKSAGARPVGKTGDLFDG